MYITLAVNDIASVESIHETNYKLSVIPRKQAPPLMFLPAALAARQ